MRVIKLVLDDVMYQYLLESYKARFPGIEELGDNHVSMEAYMILHGLYCDSRSPLQALRDELNTEELFLKCSVARGGELEAIIWRSERIGTLKEQIRQLESQE